jgi:glycosyltransferase involved in cell wall biosynthesis
MKILHVVHAYYPAIGGSEYLIKEISEYLANEKQEDVTVYTTTAKNSALFTNPGKGPEFNNRLEETINKVKVKRFPVINRWAKILYILQYILYKLRFPGNGLLRMLYYGPISPRLKKAIKEANTDIIVAAPFPLNHMNYIFKNKKKPPVILIGCTHTSDKHGFHNRRIKKKIKQAHGYVALTKHERDFLTKRWGIQDNKIKVIGVGLNIYLSPVVKEDFQTKNGIKNSHDPVIVFMGQHGLHKGIHTLIESMPLVWEQFPTARLIIAGAITPFTDFFKNRAKDVEESRGERIRFMDNIDEGQKQTIIKNCDVFASPSGHESFGITILEAWAYKKAVVACDIEPTNELIEDGIEGLLVEYENKTELAGALKRLLGDAILRKKIGEGGYLKLKECYTHEKVGQQYHVLYKDTLETLV